MKQLMQEILNSVVLGSSVSTLAAGTGKSETNPVAEKARVSVIIPTLNEANNLPLVLPYLPMDWIDEVILVDGRSTDDTVKVAKELLPEIKIILEKKRGKGAAMKAGYAAATGEILVVMDADGSNDPREIPRFVKALQEGADLVKGSRFAPGGGTTDMPLIRRTGNRGLVFISNLLFGQKFTDLCYGFHSFWKHCLGTLDLTDMDGFEIDTCLYLQSAHRKLKVIEVPSFEGYRFYGVGKLQTIPDGWRVLKTIIKEYFRRPGEVAAAMPAGFRGSRPEAQREHALGSDILPTAQEVLSREFISFLGIIVAAGVNLRDLLKRTLGTVVQAASADSGSIILLDERGTPREACLAYNGEVWHQNSPHVAHLVTNGLAGWVLKNRKAAVVPSTLDDPRWLRSVWEKEPDDSRSALVVPLLAGERPVGVLTLIRSNLRKFEESDLLRVRDDLAYA
jgi:hypothetical protein